ncbi:hypothetical protein MGG_17331 [Pyricularia oryzae 70-15]|uniref:Uncharacterized protein n=3 Tax=Pyricularia oryzae TaxID=318829 RepID=G4ND27_PYRO7|nr:uncharacterized protein MGG_17331 [Pyricularia oryzae 70-15]EHA48369.1 hypothetical protein MGG_17331 [Pyricularia oryzae 70-15]KAI7916379.1 hypothetical protein M9X92_007899 [Pyricularia oryzae]QBZ62191.1 hypothetical protein PoMZ_11067 [Pyricularia oryzae]
MAASLMLCYLPSRFRAAVTVVIKNYRPPADVAELGVLPWTRERTGKGCLDGMQFRQS